MATRLLSIRTLAALAALPVLLLACSATANRAAPASSSPAAASPSGGAAPLAGPVPPPAAPAPPVCGDPTAMPTRDKLAQLLMVGYMAMLIQRMSLVRDHDPGYDSAYALAAIAPVPLWLASLSLLVPSIPFVVAIGAAAWGASILLIRHGVRPLLHIADEKTAHYVANVVTAAGIAAIRPPCRKFSMKVSSASSR